jgi:hypothetical protein
MAYTSDTEFDLVKRIQITNEVPPLSLWHTLPSALQNDFWKYVIGTVEVETNVDVTSKELSPKKIVNNVIAPQYGPPVPEIPNFETPEKFHSLHMDGVIIPEYDFMLHELYRYLGDIYPDHPDYAQLLTPLELNEMFRAAAAIIGYTPNYTFLENWSRSINGSSMTDEEIKWKIRDLRSLAFRRKFFGSYQGYKMLFSSMHRHGSVYITGTYQPYKFGAYDPTDSRAQRKFRLIDYFGVNDTVYKENAQVSFRGLVSPSDTAKVYYHAYHNTLSIEDGPLSKISLGAFLHKDQPSSSTKITVQTAISAPSDASSFEQIHYLRLSAPVVPTLKEYKIITTVEDVAKVSDHSLQATPSPQHLGVFELPLFEAINFYPNNTIEVDSIDVIPLLQTHIVPDRDILCDEYIEEIFTYRDCALVQQISRGYMTFVIEPERSPIVVTPPKSKDPRYGVEIDTRRYVENSSGIMEVQTYSVFLQGTLSFEIDSTGRPTAATMQLATIPNINPLKNTSNRPNLFTEDNLSSVSVGATARFVTYNTDTDSWGYMYGYEGWIDTFNWARLQTAEVLRKNDTIVPQTFSSQAFEPWKRRAASLFISDSMASDELEIYGEVSSSTPNRILITNSQEAIKLNSLSTGDQVRGPGIPSGTVITQITSDYFDISNNSLRSGLSLFAISLRNTRNIGDIELSQFKTDLHTLYPTMSSAIFTAMWPSRRWPEVSQAFLEGLKDASLFQPLAVERVTDNPARILFDRSIFLEISLDRILRHPNTAGFKMGAAYASLMDLSWLEYAESYLTASRRATENVRLGTQLTLTTDRSGLYSIIPGNKHTDPSINARFITIPYNYAQDNTPAFLQLGTGGHTAERERLFTSVSDLLRPPLYGTIFYDENRDTSNDPEAISVQRRGVYSSAIRQRTVMGSETDDNIASNDHLDSPLFEIPLGEHEYSRDIAPPDLPGNRHQIIQASVYLEDFENITLQSDLIVNSPYITKGEQLPRDLYRFRGRWNATLNEASSAANPEPVWPQAPANDPFQERDYFLVSTTVEVGKYAYQEGDWLLYINNEWVRRQWLVLGEWPPSGEEQKDIYLSPSKVELQSHLAPLGLSIRDALDNYFIYFIASRDLNLLDKIQEGSTTANVIEVKRHDWIILTRETYVDDVVNNLRVRMVQNGDDYLLISPPEGGLDRGEWTPIVDPDNPTEPLWPDSSILQDLDYFHIAETKTIGDWDLHKDDYIQVSILNMPNPNPDDTTPIRTVAWKIQRFSYLSWTEYQPWLVAGGMTYEIIRQSFDRSILAPNSFNTITNQRAELIDSTLQTLDLPRRFISRGSCNFQLRIDPQFYATDANGIRFSLTEGPIYWDGAANRFYVINRSANGDSIRHYVEFQEPVYFKNLLSVVGTVFADTPTEVHVYPGHEFDASQLSLTDRVESGNYIYVRNEYEDALENKFYSHYVTAYGEVNSAEPNKIKPVSRSPLALERSEEFRLAVLGIQPKDNRVSEIRAITPAIIRSYEDRFENKFFRNLLMLGGIVTRDVPNRILPLGTDVNSMQAFAEAMSLLNPGDYVESMYITTGKTYRFALEVLKESNQAFNVIAYGPGSWLAAGTNGALVLNYSDPESSWESKALPSEWTSIVPINAAIYSHNLNTWWIFGAQGHIAVSYNDGNQWTMFTEPDDWANIKPNITCVAGTNPYNQDNVPNMLLIGTEDGRVAYFDETEAFPLWVPSPLPIDGSVERRDEDLGEEGEEPAEGPASDNSSAPLLTGWGTTPVLSVGYNPATNTWMIGGVGGKLAKTQTLTSPTHNPNDPTSDPTLPTSQWTLLQLPEDMMLANISSIQCTENTWVIGGQLGGLGVLAYSEDDGLTWSISQLTAANGAPDEFGAIHKIAWKPGEWIATSDAGIIYSSASPHSPDSDNPLAIWTKKPAPNIPSISLRALGIAGDTVIIGGANPNLYIISNTTRPAASLQLRNINKDESVFNITTDVSIVSDADWEENAEVTVLFAIRTLLSIPDSLIGIPPNTLASFTNPRTQQLYIPSYVSVESPDLANRVYTPRLNSVLLEPYTASGGPNPQYIGANGYPTYEEAAHLYITRAGAGVPWNNAVLLPLHYCDSDGRYVDSFGKTLGTNTFLERVLLEDDDAGLRIDKADPRIPAFQPLYTSYREWLEDGNDIEEADQPLPTPLSAITVTSTYNEQDEVPWITISVEITEQDLRPPYNGVSLSILPAEPTTIPLVGVPRYRTDQSGSNMGIVAATEGGEVFYSVEPLANNVSLLATRGPNTGITASTTDSGEGIYSIEPVRYLPSAFVTEDGAVIATIKDGVTYYTIDDPDLTGIYYHPNGYGSWADKPSVNGRLPWENDPNAYIGFDDDGDGLNDRFVYMQNTRQDPIYLVDQMGRRAVDSSGNFILSPAPRYLSYADLLGKSGAFAEKENIRFNAGTAFTIVGVAQDSQSFELSRPVELEAGAFVRQVRLNLLTLASIQTTESTKLDERLVHKLSIRDMARYEPDRVCYLGSAYPSQLANPEMYEAGLFTNKNGSPVYASDEFGRYISNTDTYAITTDLARRIQPPQPLHYLCQDWFDSDYFVSGSEDNPYWQYLVFEDYLDHRSKEWRQRFGTYRKVKGELGREMVFTSVPDNEAYVTIYPGLEYVQDASSMIVRQTDYIQYRLGRVNCIMVSNPRYDRRANPNVDFDNAKYGLNYQSIFHEAKDLSDRPVDMFNDSEVVQTKLRGEWTLNYTLNTTKNFANPQDTRSSIVSITELGVYNRNAQMIAYATFPPVIYDSAKHHMSVNLLIKQGEFTPISD